MEKGRKLDVDKIGTVVKDYTFPTSGRQPMSFSKTEWSTAPSLTTGRYLWRLDSARLS